MKNRREFLKTATVSGVAFLAAPAGGAWARPLRISFAGRPTSARWDQMQAILSRIRLPSFPARDFEITKFGAVGDNRTDNTEAFRKAIAACNSAGGGRVIVPQGEFVTGAVQLKSNVNLHVNNGATIRFTRDTGKYPVVLTRFEGVELMNYSPFIYAFEQENIAITGPGTIDGNADAQHWWDWKDRTRVGRTNADAPNDRDKLFQMAERGVPVEERVFGEGHFLRPMFIQPYRSKNVLIEGVTLLNSPMWQVHPVLCQNVTVQHLTIRADGPNTDGCDPESSDGVLIRDNFFSTGDDCIAIKSGRNADGRRLHVPAENIVIQNCHMQDGHGGITVGSEITGGVRNVFADQCQMDSPHLSMAIRIKNNAERGGLLENIHVRNIDVGQVANAAISIDFFYEEGERGNFKPVVRDVSIEKLTTKKAKYALYLRGFANAPIEDVKISDCDFEGVEATNVLEHVKDVSLYNVKINGKAVDKAA